MRGLIIKEIYLKRFFDSGKTAEVRSSNTKIRGKIYLCCSKKQEIWGEADLHDVMVVDQSYFAQYEHLHKANDFIGYPGKSYLWLMKDIIRYDEPVQYEHVPGCVIWINLDYKRD